MPTLIKVPEPVVKAATRGLALHSHGPRLEDVSGVAVARRLVKGEIDAETLTQCHRFFATNDRAHAEDVLEMRTADDSAIVRSWELHGGEAGRAWASSNYGRFVKEGLADADPLTELLELPPQDVYARFSAGAWRHEYGLNPTSAARFVEQYAVATGRALDLDRAFGESRPAVANAMHRRACPIDPAARLRRLACVREAAYRAAVEIDAAAVAAADELNESFPPSVYGSGPVQSFVKYAWPTVIAHFVLTVEEPFLLKTALDGYQPPAPFDKPLKPFAQYSDATNFLQAVFHPKGKRWKDPIGVAKGKYADVAADVLSMLYNAHKGRKLTAHWARKTLRTARDYLNELKMAGTVFLTLLADWQKGNWKGILDVLPPGSDVYAAFKAFADKGKLPVDGADLQQTPDADLSALLKNTSAEDGKPVPLDGTKVGAAAKAQGTPIGVGSLIQFQTGKAWEIVGAFEKPAPGGVVIVGKPTGGKSDITAAVWSDAPLASGITGGSVKVVQGHADLPGTTYNAEPKPPEQATAPAGGDPPKGVGKVAPAAAGGGDDAGNLPGADGYAQTVTKNVVPLKISDTASYKACQKTLGKPLPVGSKLTGETGSVFTVAGAYKAKALKFIVLQMADGSFENIEDADLATTIKDGDAWLAGLAAVAQDAGTGSVVKFASADDYFNAEYADSINQWTDFGLLDTDSAEAFLELYDDDLDPGTILADKNGHPFRVEAAKYNKFSGATLIVYRNPDGTFNELPDDKLAKGIKAKKATPVKTNAAPLFPAMPDPDAEPENVPTDDVPEPTADQSEADAAKAYAAQWGVMPDAIVPLSSVGFGKAAIAAGVADVDAGFRYTVAHAGTGEKDTVLAASAYIGLDGSPYIIAKKSDGTYTNPSNAKLLQGVKNGTIEFAGAAEKPKATGVLDPATATTAVPHPAGPVDPVQKYIDDWLPGATVVPLAGTLFGMAASLAGVTATENILYWNEGGKPMTAIAAVKTTTGDVRIIIGGTGGEPFTISDAALAAGVNAGSNTFTDPSLKPVNLPAKFKAGDVLKINGDPARYVVLAVDDATSQYLMYRLAVMGDGGNYVQPVDVKKVELDFGAVKLMSNTLGMLALANLAYPGPSLEVQPANDTPDAWGVAPTDVVQVDGKSYQYTYPVMGPSASMVRPLLARKMSYQWLKPSGGPLFPYYTFSVMPASIFTVKVEPTYAPTDPTPEPASVDALDAPDAETGNGELAGTQDAFDYVAKKSGAGWKVASKSESAAFTWDLGDVLAYGEGVGGGAATRTIIGYAFAGDGNPLYIMRTQTGVVNFKGAAVGNKDYGPKTGTDQSVVNALLPKPGTAAPKFPKTGYALSKVAKELAEKGDFLYYPPPSDAAFYVGTKVQDASGKKLAIVGWTKAGPESGSSFAVLSNKDGSEWFKVANGVLKSDWDVYYQYGNIIDEDTSTVTFGKGKKSSPLSVSSGAGGFTLPSDVEPPAQPPVKQPAMDSLPKSGHVSAGVFAVVPPGLKVGTGDDAASLTKATVVLTHPMNEFGGYTLTFPKGTVEKGESLEKAAQREFWEETGLHVKIVKFLGDFKGDTSVTRMFVGYVVGGNPHKAGPETDAVTFKPVGGSSNIAPLPNWATALKERDKAILAAGRKFLDSSYVFPHEMPVDEADAYSQVTGPQDVGGGSKAAGTADDAGATTLYADGNMTAATVDYLVGSSLSQQLQAWASGNAKEWSFQTQQQFTKKGYPKVGTVVNVPGVLPLPFKVGGYIEANTGTVTYRILVGQQADGTLQTLYVSSKLGAAKPTVLTPPVDIKTWTGPFAGASPSAPATDDDAVWNKLVTSSPVPVTKAVLAKLKTYWKNANASKPGDMGKGPALEEILIEKAYVIYGNPEAYPKYGDVINDPDWGSSQDIHVLGYVTFYPKSDAVKKLTAIVGQTVGGDAYMNVVEGAADLADLKVNEAAGYKSPAAFFSFAPTIGAGSVGNNVAALNAYAAGVVAGTNGNPLGILNLKQWKQVFKEAGVPNYAGLTAELLVSAMALFVPGAMTGVQRDLVLNALAHSAELAGSGFVAPAPAVSDAASSNPYTTDNTPAVLGEKLPGYVTPYKVVFKPAFKGTPGEIEFNAAFPTGVVVWASMGSVAIQTVVKHPALGSGVNGSMLVAINYGGNPAALPTAPYMPPVATPVTGAGPKTLGTVGVGEPFKVTLASSVVPEKQQAFAAKYPNGLVVWATGGGAAQFAAQKDSFLLGLGVYHYVASPIDDTFATATTPNVQTKPTKAVPPAAPVKLTLQMGAYNSVQWKSAVANLNAADFKKSGEKVAQGSNPTFALEGPGGSKWFGKQSKDGNPSRLHAETAAFKLLSPFFYDMVPFGVIELNGTPTGVQPLIDNVDPASAFKADPGDETDENKATILRHHVLDMYIGDHDGNRPNWMKRNGRLIRVDRGQAFKHYVTDGEGPTLDPKHTPSGVVGKGYAKDLLLAWGKGETEIPSSAWSAMLASIQDVQSITDDALKSATEPYFEAIKLPAAKRTKTLTLLRKARDSYLDDWTTVLKKLRKDFVWPKAAPKPKGFSVSAKANGFKPEHAQIIQEAIDAGWQGKSLAIDGPYLEDQQVMVRRVMWDVKQGQRVPATLIHFRVTYDAGQVMAKSFIKKGDITDDPTLVAGGPKALKADVQNDFWNPILAAVKTVNTHFFVKPDGKPTVETIKKAHAILPLLKSIKEATKDPFGTYAPTGETNEIVNAMATQYIDYIAIIDTFIAEAKLGVQTPMFAQFLYEPPPPPAADVANAPPPPALTVTVKKQGAMNPSLTGFGPIVHGKGKELVVTAMNNPLYNSSSQPQFHVGDKDKPAHVFVCPPGGVGMGIKDGIEGHKGVGWGICAGDPSNETVAHLLGMLEDVTGLSLKPSTEQDQEIAFWAKQATQLQDGGVVSPDSNGVAKPPAPVKKLLDAYKAAGPSKGIIDGLKAQVAAMVGTDVAGLAKLPNVTAEHGTYDARGAGYKRQLRVGWTRQKLVDTFGAKVLVAHNVQANSSSPSADTIVSFFKGVTNNGALVSNNNKAFYGVPPGGGSPGSDFQSGGTQGLFLCLRSDRKKNVLYFDISLMLRLDVYMVGTGDTFGRVTETRYTTPEQWKAKSAVGTGVPTASSPKQINARHDIDLQTYLHTVVLSSEAAAKQCRELCAAAGWKTFANGRTLEQVITSKGDD